jgi:protein TonB
MRAEVHLTRRSYSKNLQALIAGLGLCLLSNGSNAIGGTQQAAGLSSSTESFKEYRMSIMRSIYTRVVYPKRAIARNQQGVVVLKLALDKSGNLLSLNLEKASDYKMLNDAALRAVKVSAPYRQAPFKLSSSALEVSIPINFRIPE